MLKSIAPRAHAPRSLQIYSFVALGIAATGVAIAAYADLIVPIGLLSVGTLFAILFPLTTTASAVGLILLARPGAPLFETTFAGFNVTETDLSILVALIACSRIRRTANGLITSTSVRDWLPLSAWPIWMLIRALLPNVGAVEFGSPLVDLRILSTFMLVIPFWVIASRRGIFALHRFICYAAYASCLIAVGSWGLSTLGFLARGSYPLVNLATGAAQDVRPGGEILIPVLVILLIFKQAPFAFNSKVISYALVVGEILVSQTLSIVIASVAGICLVLLANWKRIAFITRVFMVIILLGATVLAANGGSSGDSADADIASRFNLAERIGQTSAQYRVTEAETLSRIYSHEPLVLVIGTGPGSRVTFDEGPVHEVKDLTHNVYNNVILKGGLVGLFFFAGGFLLLIIRLITNSDSKQKVLAGALCSIGVLSITVPFASTVSGLAGLLALSTLSICLLVQYPTHSIDIEASK